MLALLALACTPSDDPTRGRHPDPTSGTLDTAATTPGTTPDGTTPTGSTGDTGATTTRPPECDTLPMGKVPVTMLDIRTTEDFDFDALGKLVYSDYQNFLAVDVYGNLEVVAPGIHDTRGIQILENGDIVAAYISNGTVGYAERETGVGFPLLTGLDFPNALEVGDGNQIFVSETGYQDPRVRSFDLETLTPTAIADGFAYPNGLALNPAQDVLYVADGTVAVWKVPKNADGTWGPKERLYDPPQQESHDAIEVDVCGNVYTATFNNGKIYRYDPETREGVLLADIDDPEGFLYNSMRWGSNRGGWRRDVLYVTNRVHVFAVEVGIDGRRQPVDALP